MESKKDLKTVLLGTNCTIEFLDVDESYIKISGGLLREEGYKIHYLPFKLIQVYKEERPESSQTVIQFKDLLNKVEVFEKVEWKGKELEFKLVDCGADNYPCNFCCPNKILCQENGDKVVQLCNEIARDHNILIQSIPTNDTFNKMLDMIKEKKEKKINPYIVQEAVEGLGTFVVIIDNRDEYARMREEFQVLPEIDEESVKGGPIYLVSDGRELSLKQGGEYSTTNLLLLEDFEIILKRRIKETTIYNKQFIYPLFLFQESDKIFLDITGNWEKVLGSLGISVSDREREEINKTSLIQLTKDLRIIPSTLDDMEEPVSIGLSGLEVIRDMIKMMRDFVSQRAWSISEENLRLMNDLGFIVGFKEMLLDRKGGVSDYVEHFHITPVGKVVALNLSFGLKLGTIEDFKKICLNFRPEESEEVPVIKIPKKLMEKDKFFVRVEGIYQMMILGKALEGYKPFDQLPKSLEEYWYGEDLAVMIDNKEKKCGKSWEGDINEGEILDWEEFMKVVEDEDKRGSDRETSVITSTPPKYTWLDVMDALKSDYKLRIKVRGKVDLLYNSPDYYTLIVSTEKIDLVKDILTIFGYKEVEICRFKRPVTRKNTRVMIGFKSEREIKDFLDQVFQETVKLL